ncbi:hypothetical protein COCCADRAFT_38298 [Bipolaris zeicola 26-R-13]|uniref:Uncharacterized protein n=1 Tax=Cochliobolus carbonum (strain 26-R-13) TaxID=930089 RepID=W6Y0W1_COCC2|nr:uncharacterized protein COCCADRAFT_38298 [Bipolaris zeicola 26-R-13]EUC31613.1 hypothetical protein COCCADRAFT_38298 [Bipolaris zeicola 26-R-13]
MSPTSFRLYHLTRISSSHTHLHVHIRTHTTRNPIQLLATSVHIHTLCTPMPMRCHARAPGSCAHRTGSVSHQDHAPIWFIGSDVMNMDYHVSRSLHHLNDLQGLSILDMPIHLSWAEKQVPQNLSIFISHDPPVHARSERLLVLAREGGRSNERRSQTYTHCPIWRWQYDLWSTMPATASLVASIASMDLRQQNLRSVSVFFNCYDQR